MRPGQIPRPLVADGDSGPMTANGKLEWTSRDSGELQRRSLSGRSPRAILVR